MNEQIDVVDSHAGNHRESLDAATTEAAPGCSTTAPQPASLSGSSAVVAASLIAHGSSTGMVRLAHHDSHARVAPGPWQGASRQQREEAEDALLAPGATRAVGAGNRAIEEEPDPRRTSYERDLDRLKYSTAVRRLAGKCQVFLAPDNVHIRNRMTHALEVAQVSLGVAQAVGLNPALCEAMALGHDCGHGPGGHASEDAFAPYIPGGYDHAHWGADVTLAPLNLCAETLDGIRQHSWRLDAPGTPEGEALSLADRAYLAHDFDDAIRAGIVTESELPAVVRDVCGTRQSQQVRSLIRSIVECVETTGQMGLTEEYALALDAFRAFNYERIYLRPAAVVQNDLVIAMLRALIEFYIDAPGRIPAVVECTIPFPRAGSEEAAWAAVAYVSSMTDRFAMAQATQLLGWSTAQLPRGV